MAPDGGAGSCWLRNWGGLFKCDSSALVALELCSGSDVAPCVSPYEVGDEAPGWVGSFIIPVGIDWSGPNANCSGVLPGSFLKWSSSNVDMG